MRIVLLMAGVGERLGPFTRSNHKSLIPLSGKPLLGHLMERFVESGQRRFVAIVGHERESIVSFLEAEYGDAIELRAVENPRYDQANNMYSMWCARDILTGKPFVLCNGDSVLSGRIIESLLAAPEDSGIAVDDVRKSEIIDSPRVLVDGSGRIGRIGRDIPLGDSGGYAVGLYRFGAELSRSYFGEVRAMLEAGKDQAGFHDPLNALFERHRVVPVSCGESPWTDVDVEEDIPRAEDVLARIAAEEREEAGVEA